MGKYISVTAGAGCMVGYDDGDDTRALTEWEVELIQRHFALMMAMAGITGWCELRTMRFPLNICKYAMNNSVGAS